MIIIVPYQFHFIHEYQYKWPRTWHRNAFLINDSMLLLWLQSHHVFFEFYTPSHAQKQYHCIRNKDKLNNHSNSSIIQYALLSQIQIKAIVFLFFHQKDIWTLILILWLQSEVFFRILLKYTNWNLGHLETTGHLDKEVNWAGILSLIFTPITMTCNIHYFKDSV